jgi:hypothetical protein
VAGGRPTALTEELIPRAAEVAAICPSHRAIGRAIGVHHCTVRDWIQRGEDPNSPELFQRFSAAIHEALLMAEIRLADKVASGEPKDATWMLTHSPFFRDEWSDAAAERRAVQRSQDRTIAVLEAAPELTNEQRRMLFARLAAAGEHPDPGSLA